MISVLHIECNEHYIGELVNMKVLGCEPSRWGQDFKWLSFG